MTEINPPPSTPNNSVAPTASNSNSEDVLLYNPSEVAWATSEFIRTPPSLVSRSYLYVLGLLLFSAIIFCSVFPIVISVNSRGNIVTEKQVFPIRSPINLKVAKLEVVNNQTVKKGDLILISEEQLAPEEYRLIREQKDWMLRWLKGNQTGPCQNCLPQLRLFSEKAFQIETKTTLRDILSPVQELVRELVNLKQEYDNLPNLTASLRNQINQATRKLREIERRKAQSLLAVQVEQLQNEIISGKSQIADRLQSVQSKLEITSGKLELKLVNLMSAVDKYKSQQSLTAPEDGTITQLKVSGPGQYLTEGQEIMMLVPQGSTFEAELFIANRDISQVKPGQPVTLKLDALPEREFGALTGQVKTLTMMSINASDRSANDGAFKVIVKLDRQSMNKNGVEYPFRIGMSLDGFVITEYRTLTSLALKKFFNLKDSVLRN